MPKKKAAVKRGDGGRNWVLLVGRVLIALLFLVSGWGKLMDLKGTANFMAYVNMPFAGVWLAAVAGTVELLAALGLLAGWCTRVAARALVVYMLLVTWFIHLAPAIKMAMGADRSNAMLHVWMNLALLGGILLLSVAGPGRISRDKR